MLLSIAFVSGLAWWDSRRESDSVLRDVAREQSVLAAMLSANLRAHLTAVERDARLVADGESAEVADRYDAVGVRTAGAAPPGTRDVTRLVLSVPQSGGRIVDFTIRLRDLLEVPAEIAPAGELAELAVFLAPPDQTTLVAPDGRTLSPWSSPGGFEVLRDALDRSAPTARLDRRQAAQTGLVPRTAMAGLARIDAGPLGRWGVVAAGTAARPRDRETRAFWRLVLGVGLASGLVLVFGGVALRNQRKELELERELAVEQAQRAREEQLARAERVATMGTFAMGVVHEVSTPLGVISGRAEQLRSRAGPDERSIRAVEAIMGEVDRIQAIIRRFLDLARGGPPALSRAVPGDVVRAAASLVEHRFAKAGVELSIDSPPNLPAVHCDRALLDQAIVNLLLNACDACAPGGHVQLGVRADAGSVAFLVTDDGIGIPPETAARVTDPFFTTKPAGAGTGLGLAIASEIAKSHRGGLTIAPPPKGGRGTCACIELPAMIRDGGGHALDSEIDDDS
jgi:two-component system, NtrC family, sensor kinase